MAANISLEVQKEKLHLVLMSRRDGDDYGHDGIALARAHGFQSFHTFLESASMREYCRCAEELRTTTVYYGIGTEQTEHIEREMQISLPAELEKAKKEIRNLRRQLEAKKSQPNESSAHPDFSANLASKETDTQTDCKDHYEKAVQTEDPTMHEIYATLQFLKEPYTKGQNIDRRKDPKLLYNDSGRTVPLQYYGNMTVKEIIAQIFSKYPMADDIHKYESHTVCYFSPRFAGRVEISDDSPVVPNGKYFIDMNLRAPAPHKIITTLKFLKEPHARGQPIEHHRDPKFLYNWTRIVPHQYYGDITIKELIIELFSKHPTEDDIHKYESHTVRYFDPRFKKWVAVLDDISVVPNGEYLIDMNLRENNVPHKIFATLKYLSEYHESDEIIDRRLNQLQRYSSCSPPVDVPYNGSIKVKDILATIYQNNPTDEKYWKLKNYYSYCTLYFAPSFNGKDYVEVSGQSLVVPNGKYILELKETSVNLIAPLIPIFNFVNTSFLQFIEFVSKRTN
ncbi:hypothetical protein Ddc_23167 [Ditylenchus destructor]|nr:hypothetical protein Ddc_23167 [Ditylenchus destructor]